MIRRSWFAFISAAVVLMAAPAFAHADRPASVTRGLDYLHSQQADSGGFGGPTATGWVILGAVAGGERMGSATWAPAGKNPIHALQATNHETAATSSLNPPVYFSQMTMAYMAGGREEYVYAAGTPSIDLLTKLYSYQDVNAGSETFGSFSPSSSNRSFKAVRTTAWAILAMKALRIDNDAFAAASAWLRTQPNTNGGFGVGPASTSNTVDTALAVQALRAAGVGAGAEVVRNALGYLHAVQLNSGGFADQSSSGTRLDADATAFAIQAIDAAGEDPRDPGWRKGSRTPLTALRSLQVKKGAFAAHPGTLISPVPVTGHALVALSSQNFATYPARRPPAVKAFVYRPHFDTVVPKGGAVFKTTRIVTIRATYGDGKGGTGINAAAVRLYLDGANKTKPADVGRYGLHLTLKNVPNGKHTYKIVVRDHSGNERQMTRTFTVAVPVAPTTPPIRPTWRPTFSPITPPPTYHPTVRPTRRPTIRPTVTPTTTLYPTPTGSPSYHPSSPWPSPSTSGSPITGAPVNSPSPSPMGGAGSGDGSVTGFLGGTLLAMLPLGAALTYFLLQRREDAMAAAVVGEDLPGGGSGWDRTKHALAKSGDIIKPSRS